MEVNIKEVAKIEKEQVVQLMKRGPKGFKQDINEFERHLRTISESIDSLLCEYPLLLLANANVSLKFNLGDSPICECILGFTAENEAQSEG
jgi:hypothetical protein